MSDLEQKILKSHPPEDFLEEKFHEPTGQQVLRLKFTANKKINKDT